MNWKWSLGTAMQMRGNRTRDGQWGTDLATVALCGGLRLTFHAARSHAVTKCFVFLVFSLAIYYVFGSDNSRDLLN